MNDKENKTLFRDPQPLMGNSGKWHYVATGNDEQDMKNFPPVYKKVLGVFSYGPYPTTYEYKDTWLTTSYRFRGEEMDWVQCIAWTELLPFDASEIPYEESNENEE